MHRFLYTALAGVLFCTGFSTDAEAQRHGGTLPDGEGKELVQAICTGCHGPRQILSSSGYTKEQWPQLFGTMTDLSEAPKERAAVLAYLARHFPPNEKNAPKLIDGPVKVSFREWVVPTLGQRARDPVEAPDGSIWWAGQWADLVGRIDPKTGAMKEYPLPVGSKPHSVLLDNEGGVWYTGNKNATIGKLDPATGKVTEFDMPAGVKDPHTAIFDRHGIMWFTTQHSNMVGRLDPKTGEVRAKKMPRPRSRPYGIKIAASGAPWVACNGRNCLVRIDPKTMELREVVLPHRRTTVRRLDIAEDGAIWYVNSGRGRLGRYNPKSGEIREWASPSGPKSHPYAIAIQGGAVWYNESRKRPDALVRFDPRTEKFQSWPIPSGGFHAGIIRHMRTTKDGGLIIHQSSTNRIIKVTIDGEGM